MFVSRDSLIITGCCDAKSIVYPAIVNFSILKILYPLHKEDFALPLINYDKKYPGIFRVTILFSLPSLLSLCAIQYAYI